MALDLRQQALALLLALALGMGLGLAYDILRPPRRRGGRLLAALLDVSFGLLAGAVVFLYAMGPGEGRLGLWELSASCAGFLLYLHLLSPLILPILTAGLDRLCIFFAWCKKVSDKCQGSAKKYFQNVRKCFIVKR